MDCTLLIDLWNALPGFYATNLRGSLFSGLLTITGFLLATKTFIIAQLKRDVYDQTFYSDRVARARKLDPDRTIHHYGPLRRVGKLLFGTAAASLIGALLQITLGLFVTPWAVLICLLACLVALVLVGWSMVIIKWALDDWFDGIEKEKTPGNPPSSPPPG